MKRKTMDFFSQDLRKYKTLWRAMERKSIVCSSLKKIGVDGMRILDLGCGVGAYSHELHCVSNLVVSMDVASEALLVGKKSSNIVYPIRGDGSRLPFRDNSFDVILLIEVIEEVSRETNAFLNEIGRVLSAGGFIILTTSPIKSDVFYSIISKTREKGLFGLKPIEGHICEQHPSELKRALKHFRFSIVHEKYWNSFHLWSTQRALKKNRWISILKKLDEKIGKPTICQDMFLIARKRPAQS